MPQSILLAEYLTLDGFSLSTTGWTHIDLSQLLDGPDLRGSDRLVPGAAGVVSFPRRISVSKRQLPMVIFGDLNDSGAPYGDIRAGLEANIDALKTNVLAIPGSADGCRAGVLRLANGVVKTARVKVISPMGLGPVGPYNQRAVLDLELPFGVFV